MEKGLLSHCETLHLLILSIKSQIYLFHFDIDGQLRKKGFAYLIAQLCLRDLAKMADANLTFV